MTFPNCTIHTMPQRSDEWFAIRKGVLTASNFGPWLLKSSDQTSRKARESAICKLIAERAGCWSPPNFENAAMQRGTELEPQAVDSFITATGKRIKDVGFIKSDLGAFGCSPDGLIEGEPCGFEGKVPLPETHIKYRRAGVLPDEYYYQIHGSMAVTGAESWWFQSWNPGLAPLRLQIRRTEFTDQLREALIAFSVQFEEAWDQECKANGVRK